MGRESADDSCARRARRRARVCERRREDVANMSKDFAYYVISLGVAYEDDPDRVVQVLTDAGASLRDDPAFQPHLLAPLEVYGIDAFETDRLVVKGRIKTVPQKQWLVGRELRKRIARLLRERGIHAPVRPVTFVERSEPKTRRGPR